MKVIAITTDDKRFEIEVATKELPMLLACKYFRNEGTTYQIMSSEMFIGKSTSISYEESYIELLVDEIIEVHK